MITKMIDVVRVTPELASQAENALQAVYHRRPATADVLARLLANTDFVLILARSGEDGVGYAFGHVLGRLDGKRMLLVYDVQVHADWRGRGIGRRLIEACFAAGEEAGVDRTWLVTEPDNAPARSLYTSLEASEFAAVGYQWTK